MAYGANVEALRRRFGKETDTSIALQELAGLRRGKNESAKELTDSARRLASRATIPTTTPARKRPHFMHFRQQ